MAGRHAEGKRAVPGPLVLRSFGVGLATSTPDATAGGRLRLHATSDGDLELEIDDPYARDVIPAGVGAKLKAGSVRLDVRLKASTPGECGRGVCRGVDALVTGFP